MPTYRIEDKSNLNGAAFRVVLIGSDGGEELLSSCFPNREAAYQKVKDLQRADARVAS
jgi:hypothetical protein